VSVPSVCLIVLDGWGLAPDGPGNAVALADTPVFDALWERHPHTTLTAKGEDVGLPPGQMGNSEVGHLNLGAGAIVPQDLARIDAAVRDGSLAENDVLNAAITAADRVHLIGLVSSGGVHSSEEHLKALITLAAERRVPDLVIHAFTDGRDTSPTSGAGSLAAVEATCRERGAGRVGSVIGRYYAMDRDKRWERTDAAVAMLCEGRADHHADTGEAAVKAAYERGETDEFITATTVGDEARIRPGDAVIAFNFRPDRMRQITTKVSAVVDSYTTLTQYDEDWTFPIVFPPHRPATTIGALIAAAGKAQLHVAETEKYPHVTYFFNGGEEDPYEGEVRELVPSPRDVPTYDHKPEMSAREAPLGRAGLRVRDHQLRQRRHGRPHGRDRGRGGGGRDRRRVPRADRRGGRVEGRLVHRHGRPRQRGRDARGGRLARHRALAQPGAADRHRGRGRARRRRDPRGRRPDGARAARDGAAGRDDRPLAARLTAGDEARRGGAPRA
jgi:2,3-bisphosphoglycerate-independent phosphoglycerate mutase